MNSSLPSEILAAFQDLKLPDDTSHKGQNGKLLLVGGSDLFHAASRWSLDVASHFVDMVFYSSVPSNNQLVQEAKGQFWNGIVVRREDMESYAEEADCILIGPGMTRGSETEQVVDALVKKFAHKKWVIDAGALQMISPQLLTQNMVITPHPRELAMVVGHLENTEDIAKIEEKIRSYSSDELKEYLSNLSKLLSNVTILLKGKLDLIANAITVISIAGGNAGMTKGGTGDVLAGLVAALACTNTLQTASIIGSYTNKVAADTLHEKVGPFFNSSELVTAIPETLWSLKKSTLS